MQFTKSQMIKKKKQKNLVYNIMMRVLQDVIITKHTSDNIKLAYMLILFKPYS